MQYLVTGKEGKEYGPVDFQTLRLWLEEDRISQSTKITDMLGGFTSPAIDVPGLFDGSPVEPPERLTRDAPPVLGTHVERIRRWEESQGTAFFVTTLINAAAAFLFLFLVGSLGLFLAGLSIVYGYRTYRSGSKFKWAALAISIGSFVFILVYNLMNGPTAR